MQLCCFPSPLPWVLAGVVSMEAECGGSSWSRLWMQIYLAIKDDMSGWQLQCWSTCLACRRFQFPPTLYFWLKGSQAAGNVRWWKSSQGRSFWDGERAMGSQIVGNARPEDLAWHKVVVYVDIIIHFCCAIDAQGGHKVPMQDWMASIPNSNNLRQRDLVAVLYLALYRERKDRPVPCLIAANAVRMKAWVAMVTSTGPCWITLAECHNCGSLVTSLK